jgi:prepilin-type N-terminal cleavage/methylation domain-containing protein
LGKNNLRNEKGFTLIEIIAVLVILGILAAVAVPKYLSMVDETRTQSAQAAIAEIKGRLSAAQAKYMVNNGGLAPTSPQLWTYATNSSGYGSSTNLLNVGSDFVAGGQSGTPIQLWISSIGGQTVSVNSTYTSAGD